MRRVSEYLSTHIGMTLEEAEKMAIATINHVYEDIAEDSHATCEEIHMVKKSLECLHLIHELKHESKM